MVKIVSQYIENQLEYIDIIKKLQKLNTDNSYQISLDEMIKKCILNGIEWEIKESGIFNNWL